MVRKKQFDFKKILIIGSVPTALIAILGFIVASSKTITVYADLPKEVQQTQAEVVDVKEYIKEQKMANDLMQKIVTEKNEKVLSPDGKFMWDQETQKWRKL